MKENQQISEEVHLEIEKIRKENRLLDLEINSFKEKSDFIGKRISWLIAFATLIISATQVITSQISAKKEIQIMELENERRYELDLVNFVIGNQDDIFSSDIEKRSRIRNIMYVTFPAKITEAVFTKIGETAKDESVRFFWQGSRNLSIGVVEIDSLIRRTQGTRERIKVELWINDSKQTILGELLESANYIVVFRESNNLGNVNSLRYDKSLSIENIQLISLLMLNSKIDLKQIKVRGNDTGISQIVNEPYFDENPRGNYSVDEIMKFKK